MTPFSTARDLFEARIFKAKVKASGPKGQSQTYGLRGQG